MDTTTTARRLIAKLIDELNRELRRQNMEKLDRTLERKLEDHWKPIVRRALNDAVEETEKAVRKKYDV